MSNQEHRDSGEDGVQTGERYEQCPVTNKWYRVTKWENRPNGRTIALEKEHVAWEQVPEGQKGR